MADIRIDAFWSAANALEAAADRMSGTWSRELINDMRSYAREAQRQYDALAKIMPDVREYQRQKADAYDRYVTREPDAEGCSCHINPPCSYCTSQSDEEESE